MTKKIMLACAGGYSTSMLVETMKEAASKQDLQIEIDAIPESAIPKHVDSVDIIMLGPQMGHAEEGLKKKYGDRIPITVIDMMDYGMMDGGKVLKKALELMGTL